MVSLHELEGLGFRVSGLGYAWPRPTKTTIKIWASSKGCIGFSGSIGIFCGGKGYRGFPASRGPVFEVPRIRIIVCWGLYWGPSHLW